MKILITGGGGFIGSHLVDHQLAQGHTVRVLDHNTDQLTHLAGLASLQVIRGDITHPELVRQAVWGIDVVYHLASAHLDVSRSDGHYWRVNVDGTLGLLRAARAAGVGRVVHCSSVGVIGNVLTPPADEATDCRPTNIYEKTKLAGEQAALRYGAETGLAVVVARPAWVYGPRCPRTERLLKSIRNRRFVMFGHGKTLRHPLFVADAVRGLELCAAAAHVPGQCYILAGERAMSIEELVATIAAVYGVSPPTLRLPARLGFVGGYVLELLFKGLSQPPPFSRRTLDFYLKNNSYRIDRAERDLGFRPEVDLPAGVSETVRWLNSQPGEKRSPKASPPLGPASAA